jgi:hypothetical protein
MPTAEHVRDLTMDTIGSARVRAEDLAKTASRLAHDVDLPSVEVPAVDELVEHAVSHKVRTTLALSLVLLVIFVLVRKVLSGGDEPVPDTAS